MTVMALPLGEMTVIGVPPPKLLAALAIIADKLHPILDAQPRVRAGHSKVSCIWCSAIVREFLFRLGFRDAELRACVFAIVAEKDGGLVHSLGIGNPVKPDLKRQDSWDGHAVCTAGGWLIDTTLYQMRRPQWANFPGMMALQLLDDDQRVMFWGKRALTGSETKDCGNDIAFAWMDQRENTRWRQAPDYLRRRERSQIVDQLMTHWKLEDA